jgi:cytosine/adenosine deaminase-related metal-dependent hydrolase
MERTIYAPLLVGSVQGSLNDARVKVSGEGRILEIIQGAPQPDDLQLDGVLVPGWVNAHCHIELSHLAEVFKGNAMGMAAFLQGMLRQRNCVDETQRMAAMQLADSRMHAEGVVAVGDISNSLESLPIKKGSEIVYHTFVEVLGLNPLVAENVLSGAQALVTAFSAWPGASASLAPHAPYSLSDALFDAVLSEAGTQSCTSYHLMESEDELQFFADTSGPLRDVFEQAGLPLGSVTAHHGISPLKHFMQHWNFASSVQFVHNVFVAEREISEAIKQIENPYWCLCPSANRFISGRLPDIDAFRRQGARITVGTDSLASNASLSMVQELSCIQQSYPHIPFPELIEWATWNGACFLGREHELGRIELGKKPGLVLLTGINTSEPSFTQETKAVRV